MLKVNLVLYFLSFYLLGFSQENDTINQIDTNGLKIGYWKLDQIADFEELSYEGNFIVIPLDLSIDYSKDFKGITFLHFESNKLTLSYSGKTDSLISVADGEWISYRKTPDNNNKIASILYYNNGYSNKSKSYPAKNKNSIFSEKTKITILTDSLRRTDIYVDNDTVVFESYNEKTKYTSYPNNSLNFDNNVLGINSLYTKPGSTYIKFKARKDIKIDSISCDNQNLIFLNSKGDVFTNLKLLSTEKDSIKVIYEANRNDNSDKSKITIHASDNDYKLFFWLSAFDVGRNNIEEIEILNFNDLKEFYIQTISDHYFALYENKLNSLIFDDIYKGEGAIKKAKHFDFGSAGNINISDLNGVYYLAVVGPKYNKQIKIIIK